MTFDNGSTFAGFTIIKQIGAGGMGEVYLAKHPRLPRREALKILPAELCADDEYRARFHREADLAAALWHPNIVAVHDRGENDGRLWISMDYVDGTDAAQLLRDRYPDGMPPAEAITVVSAVAEALEYAHEHSLLHRDVKPSNILISTAARTAQRIVLADFGIARHIDNSDLTATNIAIGTVNYASPEQFTGTTIDSRSDQYSLAATAYQLLSGDYPFQHSNPAVVIGHHINSPAPQLGKTRPDLAGFDAPLSRAMAKRPEQRFASCRDFAAALANAASGHCSARTQAAPRSPAMAPTTPAHPQQPATPTTPAPPLAKFAPAPTANPPSAKPPHWGALTAVIAITAALIFGLARLSTQDSSAPLPTSSAHSGTSEPYLPFTTTYYPTTHYSSPGTTTSTASTESTTPVTNHPYWDGIWLRDYVEHVGDCDSPHTYWVVQPGDTADTSALKSACFPDAWIDALNDKGHALKWSKQAYFALWDPDRVMSAYNRIGDLQMIGLAVFCLTRAHLSNFHEGPVHNDCLVTPKL